MTKKRRTFDAGFKLQVVQMIKDQGVSRSGYSAARALPNRPRRAL